MSRAPGPTYGVPRPVIAISILFFVSSVAALIFRHALLNDATRILVTCDPLQKADLIYVLGGNYAVRAPAAAAVFRQGWASKILLAREPEPSPGRENFTEITQRILIEHGVPRNRIIQIAPAEGVRSTADEAHALRLYLQTYQRSTVLVVTSAFHTRRARLALTRAVPNNVRIVMFAVNDPDCPVNTWPADQYCRHKVEMEWTKLIYYFFTFYG